MNVQAQLAAAAKQRYKQMNGIAETPPATSASRKKKEPIVTGAHPSSTQAAKKAAAAALEAKMGKSSPAKSQPPLPKGPPPKKINSSRASALSSSLSNNTKIPPAPASSRAPGGPLTADEEKIASQYSKMMKIGMPEGAVRHKMSLDGVAGHIVEAVISGGVAQATPRKSDSASASTMTGGGGGGGSSLSPGEEQIASQYRKMMKIGMPEGAVRHKMNMDGVSSKIQDSVVAGEVAPRRNSGAPARPGNGGGPMSSLSQEEEMIASQYRKLMKIGMPEGAVRHKMTMDGVSNKIQNSVVAGEVAVVESSPASTSSSSSGAKGAKGNLSSLSKEEEHIASQYRRMMKVGMPEGAVRHKMNMDGVSAKIQDSVVAGELPNPDSLHDTNSETPVRLVNPMAAAIAGSGGMGSLKKATMIEKENREPVPGRPANPLAAAIAASGGQSSLKKASATASLQNPSKPQSTNSIAAELAASGFKSSLKKAQNRGPQEPPKPQSTNSMAAQIAASGFQSSLRKTTPQRKAPPSSAPGDSDFTAMLEQRKLKPATGESNYVAKNSQSLPPMSTSYDADFASMLQKGTASPSKPPPRPPMADERSRNGGNDGQFLTKAAPPAVTRAQTSPTKVQPAGHAKTLAPQQKMDAPKSSPSLPVKTDAPASTQDLSNASGSTIAAMVENRKAKAAATMAGAPATEEATPKQSSGNNGLNGVARVTSAPEPPEILQSKVESESKTISSSLPPSHGVGDELDRVIEEKKINGEIETATKVQNVKDLGNGQQEIVVATANVTTDGTTSSGKRTRERKRKPKETKETKKDDGVDHHCACIVM
jgi:Subunit CCDC53 of WASH complex